MKLIGITMGDPAGIGPEICLKAISSNTFFKAGYIIFGSAGVLNYYRDLLNIKTEFNLIKGVQDFKEGYINVMDVVPLNIGDVKIGVVDGNNGDAAFKYVEKAIHLGMDGQILAVVTAPLNKEALHLGGHNYAGHTEIFAKLTGTQKYAMILIDKGFRVIHVSTHCSLREACDRVKTDRVFDCIRLANDTLKKVGIVNPRIAVSGLNPHAGENGLFGMEEINEIKPAVEKAKQLGISVFGPLPPDTVYLKAYNGEYDIVVAMYHDQGHIPLKILGFNSGVNMTVGLPFIRTSVDHGTAFDIAGKGIANENSMIEAMKASELFI